MGIDNQELIFLTAFLISFLATFITVPWIIPRLVSRGLVGTDMNKRERPKVPEMGGLVVVSGFFAGAYSQLILNNHFDFVSESNSFILASMVTVIGIAFVGIIDDLLGMRQRTKAFLPFFFAIPLGIYVSEIMYIPLFGNVDFGYFMLLLVPIGVACASNSTNMLEGFNGLGVGLGIIISFSLMVMAYFNSQNDALFLLIPLFGSLLAFFFYNKFPSRVFPGDTLMLFMGATIGCGAILGNLKMEGVILLLPMIVEFFLKLRGNFRAECFAEKVEENGVLVYSGPIESLTHLVMKKFTVTENGLLYIFWGTEVLLSLFVIFLNYNNII